MYLSLRQKEEKITSGHFPLKQKREAKNFICVCVCVSTE